MKIRAKTRRGAQRIEQAGTDEAIILKRDDRLPMGQGPWILVQFGNHSRWVHIRDDKDFEVIE